MKLTKRVTQFSAVNGVGLVRDSRGRLTLLSNRKNNSKPISKGSSVYVHTQFGRDITK